MSFANNVWLEEAKGLGIVPGNADQFNSVEQNLIASLQSLFPAGSSLHAACCKDSIEDIGNTAYLKNCAEAAGLKSNFVYIDEITWNEDGDLYDQQKRLIENLWKLYPWEWFLEDDTPLPLSVFPHTPTRFFEPAWKYLLSSKGIMTVLWEYFENHSNLLETYFIDDSRAAKISSNCVQKPLLSREGFNIKIIKDGRLIESTDGPYGEAGYILQEYYDLPEFGGNFPVVSVWLVRGQPCGIGMREEYKSRISQNAARFVPHIVIS